MRHDYSLSTDEAGRRRLEILNRAMWPSSRRLLRAAGLRKGMSFLDVGCGPGALTARVAALGVRATGVDRDAGFVEFARSAHPTCAFEVLPVERLSELDQVFDVVYARYLLSHLSDPSAAIEAMKAVTRPGGRIVLEDIDFDLHVAEPKAWAWGEYLRLYFELISRRGGDALLGRRLFALATDAGLGSVRANVQVSVFTSGDEKRIASLTLMGIRAALVQEGLATEPAIEEVLQGLRQLEEDPKALVSVAGTHQVWGRVG